MHFLMHFHKMSTKRFVWLWVKFGIFTFLWPRQCPSDRVSLYFPVFTHGITQFGITFSSAPSSTPSRLIGRNKNSQGYGSWVKFGIHILMTPLQFLSQVFVQYVDFCGYHVLFACFGCYSSHMTSIQDPCQYCFSFQVANFSFKYTHVKRG